MINACTSQDLLKAVSWVRWNQNREREFINIPSVSDFLIVLLRLLLLTVTPFLTLATDVFFFHFLMTLPNYFYCTIMMLYICFLSPKESSTVRWWSLVLSHSWRVRNTVMLCRYTLQGRLQRWNDSLSKQHRLVSQALYSYSERRLRSNIPFVFVFETHTNGVLITLTRIPLQEFHTKLDRVQFFIINSFAFLHLFITSGGTIYASLNRAS